MKIKVDFNFTLNEIIEKGGIDYYELENLIPQIDKIHNKILKLKEKKEIGFFELPYIDTTIIKETSEKYKEFFSNCVILGIGGSALGTSAIYQALGNYFNNFFSTSLTVKKLFVIDNVDPDIFGLLINKINLDETFFVIVSKSGSTAETISQFLIIRNILLNKYDFDGYKKRIVVITDPYKGPLRDIVKKENLQSFDIPENVGGRFSALSPVSLFPLSFVGVNIDELLEGALFMERKTEDGNLFINPSYLLGTLHYLAYKKGKNIAVLMPYSNRLYGFSDWFRQLWAESLGKKGLGQTPVKALGTTDQHSQLQLYMEGPKDKIIGFIKVENFTKEVKIPINNIHEDFSYLENKSLNNLINTELDAVSVALAKNFIMNYTIKIDNITPFVIGELIFMYELMTVFTGFLLEVNPFDQPGVEMGKKFTYGLMERKGFEIEKKEFFNFFKRKSNNFII